MNPYLAKLLGKPRRGGHRATRPKGVGRAAGTRLSYNRKLVAQLYAAAGLPEPLFEYRFHPKRLWRFDIAFPLRGGHCTACAAQMPTAGVAIEVQGGIWTNGRHTRGAALKKEWEKLNTAAIQGWRLLYIEPKEVLSTATIEMIKAALQPSSLTSNASRTCGTRGGKP